MTKIAIIGAGLSGLMSALILSKETDVKVTIFEKGQPYSNRLLSKEANMLQGVGGAGTISGGKLCFPPASSGVWKKTGLEISDFKLFTNKYLKTLLNNDILDALNTSYFYTMSKSKIINKNFETKLLLGQEMQCFINTLLVQLKKQDVIIRTNTNFKNCRKIENSVILHFNNENDEPCMESFDYIIIASGRSSAKDIYEWLPVNYLEQVSPDLGIRLSIETNENEIFSGYGKDIKLKSNYGNISARTFCVCSGGNKTLINYEGQQYFDGHFGDVLSNIVNFGILVRNKDIIGVNNAIKFCKELGGFTGEDISLKDILIHKTKFLRSNSRFSYVLETINYFVNQLVNDGYISANLDKYQVFMPSIDRLNPVIFTNKYFETAQENIYVVGDAAGVSRGFIQSMWSAFFASENILWKLALQEHTKKKAA